jgi:hypothetical protein
MPIGTLLDYRPLARKNEFQIQLRLEGQRQQMWFNLKPDIIIAQQLRSLLDKRVTSSVENKIAISLSGIEEN